MAMTAAAAADEHEVVVGKYPNVDHRHPLAPHSGSASSVEAIIRNVRRITLDVAGFSISGPPYLKVSALLPRKCATTILPLLCHWLSCS